MAEPVTGDLQDGMLAYYLEMAKFSDVNVEKRIDREPFDYRFYPPFPHGKPAAPKRRQPVAKLEPSTHT